MEGQEERKEDGEEGYEMFSEGELEEMGEYQQ